MAALGAWAVLGGCTRIAEIWGMWQCKYIYPCIYPRWCMIHAWGWDEIAGGDGSGIFNVKWVYVRWSR